MRPGKRDVFTQPRPQAVVDDRPLSRFLSHSQLVDRASHAATAFVENVRVDHRRAHVGVAEQFLDGPDVVASLQQMSCERMSSTCGEQGLFIPRVGRLHAPPAAPIARAGVPEDLPRARVGRARRAGKDPLPAQAVAAARYFVAGAPGSQTPHRGARATPHERRGRSLRTREIVVSRRNHSHHWPCRLTFPSSGRTKGLPTSAARRSRRQAGAMSAPASAAVWRRQDRREAEQTGDACRPGVVGRP